MALLDQLAEGCFRKLDDGWAFRPWRVVGTPFRVSDAEKTELAGFVSGHAAAALVLLAARLIAEQILAEDMPEAFAGLASFANGVTAAGLVAALISYGWGLRGRLNAQSARAPWPPAPDSADEPDSPGAILMLAATGGIAALSAAAFAFAMLLDGDLTGTATGAIGAGLIGTFAMPYVRAALALLQRWKRDRELSRRDP